MNIHLVDDEKFINRSFERFENYYPKQNIFIVNVSKNFTGKLNFVLSREEIVPVVLIKNDSYAKLFSFCSKGDHIFIHSLTPMKVYLALRLKKELNVTLYWILYGADLYGLLQKKIGYQLVDYKMKNRDYKSSIQKYLVKLYLLVRFKSSILNLYQKFFNKLDFFCFWNHYDYQLFIDNFNTNARFKYFRYFEGEINEEQLEPNKKVYGQILVNHSASLNGNHLTILKKLKEIDKKRDIKNLIVPLSYGSDLVKQFVNEYSYENLKYCYNPINSFLKKNEYFTLLNCISVAFFGHNRQEGGNNIFYLLANGAKIFLRKNNNLLKYLKEKSYYVYEFESEFNSMDDLNALPQKLQKHNKKLVLKAFSIQEIDKTYKLLIEVY